MPERLIGSDMDALGVTMDLDSGDAVEKVVVVAIVNSDGSGDTVAGRKIYTGVSADLDWIDQYAMLKLGAKFALGDDED